MFVGGTNCTMFWEKLFSAVLPGNEPTSWRQTVVIFQLLLTAHGHEMLQLTQNAPQERKVGTWDGFHVARWQAHFRKLPSIPLLELPVPPLNQHMDTISFYVKGGRTEISERSDRGDSGSCSRELVIWSSDTSCCDSVVVKSIKY
ncbi:hypothetical protein HAX54_034834 [Datura stramonium]|uniref:Uncharacterized protein n=1 Tax=Datura stramonium TaxID=4076 RepID=A0ABS8SEW9_DATST|nr:hypothetical protein [Datura stramonium]